MSKGTRGGRKGQLQFRHVVDSSSHVLLVLNNFPLDTPKHQINDDSLASCTLRWTLIKKISKRPLCLCLFVRLKVCDIVSLLWPFYVAVAVAVCVFFFFCSLSATKNGVIINRCLARDADLDNPLLVHFVFFFFILLF